jgi:hypothetical protein
MKKMISMEATPQKPGKPAGMKTVITGEYAEADGSTEEVQSTPRCRETLRILNEIFESIESMGTCQHKPNAISQ